MKKSLDINVLALPKNVCLVKHGGGSVMVTRPENTGQRQLPRSLAKELTMPRMYKLELVILNIKTRL